MKKILLKILGVIITAVLILLGLKWKSDATDKELERVDKYKKSIADKKLTIKKYKDKIKKIKNKYSKIIK